MITTRGTHSVPLLYMDTSFSEYIGVIGRTHGVDGTVVLQDTVGLTLHLPAGAEVAVGYTREFTRVYTVRSYHDASREPRLALNSVTTVEAAAPLIDQAVYVQASSVARATNERYAIGDIEGSTVVTDEDVELGRITDVWLLPANDVWVVTNAEGRTIPLPVIDDVIKHVDVDGKRITVHLLPGLVDLDEPSEDADDA